MSDAENLPPNGSLADAIARARAHAPFLRLQLDNRQEVAEALAAGSIEGALAAAARAGESEDVAAGLRRERSATALALAIGDLAGLLPLEGVVGPLSDLADRLIERAVAAAMADRAADEQPRGFAVIALGKYGSRELNFSSDVDLIFLYDPATLPRHAREEPQQAAVRIGQRVVELLQRRDGDGYAFRVDLRLRPSPEVTPIALPADAAISYYESAALPWERAAFIRARAVAGDRSLGDYFLSAIHPFIWRRSLDFGAIGEIQSISTRIRDHYAQGQLFAPGYDLKRGRGGIREVEFFAQVHQLIHGGRDPGLRAPATLDALAALAAAERIPADEARDLGEAYRLLRTIEHRLQMVDDRQTHSLPGDGAALDNVARLHGLESGAALLGLLRPPIQRVAGIYDQLAPQPSGALPAEPHALEAWLSKAGFADPVAARMRIEGWRSGSARSLRTAAARDAFEAMLPGLLEALGATPASATAINRFDDIVARLPSGINLYRLIDARPAFATILAQILGHAPALSDALGRRPDLLDGLIDASAFDAAGPVDSIVAELAQAGRADEDYQQLLDRVRRTVNERRFALGVQLVLGASDPLEVGAGYARVAEATVQVLADAAVREFAATHGSVPGSELVILGLGRLGGAELTHASDLDLIYLFTGTHEGESDGRKPLRAADYFNRLAPRVTAALSVATAAGPLYEVDTRLRPSGKDGLLAVSLPSFAAYQAGQAWTWEHMALTRARPVYGSGASRAALDQVIDETLRRPRNPATLIADAARMRGEIAANKPPAGPFDVKLGPGGLVDLEFALQVQQLRHGVGLKPHLGEAIDELLAAGLAPAGIAEARALLTRMLVTLRLVAPAIAEPAEASRPLIAQACGHEDWNSLLAAHDAARQTISNYWAAVTSEKASW
jgi:glutamate-ammonia-ligase adenylyltransferase